MTVRVMINNAGTN